MENPIKNSLGNLRNGYDYDIQCWVREGLVLPCGHRLSMDCRCAGRKYAGRTIAYARKKESEKIIEGG